MVEAGYIIQRAGVIDARTVQSQLFVKDVKLTLESLKLQCGTSNHHDPGGCGTAQGQRILDIEDALLDRGDARVRIGSRQNNRAGSFLGQTGAGGAVNDFCGDCELASRVCADSGGDPADLIQRDLPGPEIVWTADVSQCAA